MSGEIWVTRHFKDEQVIDVEVFFLGWRVLGGFWTTVGHNTRTSKVVLAKVDIDQSGF